MFDTINDPKEFARVMKQLEKEMYQFAENLEFEQAARTVERNTVQRKVRNVLLFFMSWCPV